MSASGGSRRWAIAFVLPIALGLSACPPPPQTSEDGGGLSSTVGEDQVVTLFDATHVYFAGEDNRREVSADVAFPPANETYSAITLDVTLACPSGGCDAYDRLGALSVADADGTPIEVARFVTPFGIASSFSLDVTALRPLLSSADGQTRAVTAFIDTWVGPGSNFGAGWELTATLSFEGGEVERPVAAVVPLWIRQRVVVGDPARPPSESAGEAAAEVGDDAGEVEVWTFVSGHGQGNADNCAEFCPTFQALSLDSDSEDAVFAREVWRDDCEEEAPGPQPGTWTLSRAGWCPGLAIEPWVETLDASGTLRATWDPGPYVNTCRPDAAPCQGCTLGTGCEYDGGAHTEPGFELSALAIVYE